MDVWSQVREATQVVVGSDGRRWVSPVPEEDLDQDRSALIDHLSRSGIPASPADRAYLPLLPGGASVHDVESVVNEAIATAPSLDLMAERHAIERALPPFLAGAWSPLV